MGIPRSTTYQAIVQKGSQDEGSGPLHDHLWTCPDPSAGSIRCSRGALEALLRAPYDPFWYLVLDPSGYALLNIRGSEPVPEHAHNRILRRRYRSRGVPEVVHHPTRPP